MGPAFCREHGCRLPRHVPMPRLFRSMPSAVPQTSSAPRHPLKRWLIAGTVIIALCVAGVAAWLLRPSPRLPTAIIFTTRAPFSAATLLADSRGWFREAGVDVRIEERTSGRMALAELTDGRCDFATAAETPIMFSLLKNTPIKVIATLGISFDNTTLVGR